MDRKQSDLIQYRWIESALPYTGKELRSHFVREKSGIRCDGVIAFAGPCRVDTGALVDLEDAARGETIVAERMLHFIGEHFSTPLREANYRLRLFVSILKETIEEMIPGTVITRRGDDLFLEDRK
ncbi:MAG: DUF366 family protein, partial [Candidatus Krumholzibacteriota bacterium]|nr:DUF366 family protein [Candidatus Krumholzibacteriota bacterium]